MAQIMIATNSMRLNSRLLPALIALFLVLQLIFPHRAWVTVLIALGGAWLIAYLWARSLARGLRLTRERRFGLAQVGDQIEERFTLTNEGPFPALWFEASDESTLPGYRISRATGIEGYTELQWITQGVCERRGAFTLGPTTLRTGDPFGIYTAERRYETTTPVFVLPPIVPLPSIEVAPGGRAGEGRRKHEALERTVSAAGVRQYVAGDELRSIHWPTSARRESLFVRLFDNMPAGDWWIYLDLNRRAQAGEGANSTLEHGVILAASLIDHGLSSGHAVGLVMHGETLTRLPPLPTHTARLDMLRALALAAPGPLSLASLLSRVRPPLRQLASLVVITADTSGDWIESLLPSMWRGAVPTVLLLDPASFGGAGDAAPILAALTELSLTRYLITRNMLDRPEAHPGQRGFRWRVTPTGRAILATQASELEWKSF
jgi:uncharacterized protein (DUF58 family)